MDKMKYGVRAVNKLVAMRRLAYQRVGGERARPWQKGLKLGLTGPTCRAGADQRDQPYFQMLPAESILALGIQFQSPRQGILAMLGLFRIG